MDRSISPEPGPSSAKRKRKTNLSIQQTLDLLDDSDDELGFSQNYPDSDLESVESEGLDREDYERSPGPTQGVYDRGRIPGPTQGLGYVHTGTGDAPDKNLTTQDQTQSQLFRTGPIQQLSLSPGIAPAP